MPEDVAQEDESTLLKRTGQCKRCGVCCMTARMSFAKSDVAGGNEDAARDLLRWWSLRPGTFVKEGEDTIEFGIDAPCKFLSFDEDGKATCLIQDNKPQICRDFPTRPVGKCPGYTFVPTSCSCVPDDAGPETTGEDNGTQG